jgi:hypothetical protein
MMTEESGFDSRQRQSFSLLHSFQTDPEVLPEPYQVKRLEFENNTSSFLVSRLRTRVAASALTFTCPWREFL